MYIIGKIDFGLITSVLEEPQGIDRLGKLINHIRCMSESRGNTQEHTINLHYCKLMLSSHHQEAIVFLSS